MVIPRRRFLSLAAGGIALPGLSRITLAQTYPTRPMRIVTGFSAGGTGDIFARVMGHWLSERLGQPVIIENRAGAGGNIGAEVVVRSPPDGHTLHWTGVNTAINATLYDHLNFNFIRDTSPVASILRQQQFVLVHPSVPAMTVRELIAYAKDNPGKLNMASIGVGSAPHLSGELFKMMAGVDMVHVPYRGGGPALTDLLAGQVQVYFTALGPAIEYITTGKLRALATTGVTRSAILPDLPTISDFVPGYEVTTWFGLSAARNTPGAIVDKLNQTVNAGLADSGMQTRISELGGEIFASSPAEFGKFIADETEKWTKVVRFSGARLG